MIFFPTLAFSGRDAQELALHATIGRNGDRTRVITEGQELTVTIDDIALPDGYGVARHEGRVVFVPGALSGDMVRTRIVKVSKGPAYGERIELVQPSEFREEPQCPYSAVCGGCELQGLSYDKQLDIKQNHLFQCLKRIGSIESQDFSVLRIVPSVKRFRYRSKIEFAFGQDNGKTVIGLTERVSPLQTFTGRIIEVTGCMLFDAVTEDILSLARDYIETSGIKAYDPTTGAGCGRRLVIRRSAHTGEVMVNFILSWDPGTSLSDFAHSLRDSVDSVVSVYVLAGSNLRLLAGKSHITERVGSFSLKVYPLSFFQPNPHGAEDLYSRIPHLSGLQGEELCGLYCGSGAVEIFLSPYVRKVTAIDVSGESIACAKENATLNGIENITFVRAKAEHVANFLQHPLPGAVLIDPPRSGMTKEAIRAIESIDPAKLIYISCNPATLARDLRILGEHFVPKEMIPFDFFPYTGHFEVLTFLERK
jgi:23S rRNA (uracil1939-C5)-methyltransferase